MNTKQTIQSKPGEMYKKHMSKMKKKAVKLVPASKGHTPKGAHGRAAVKALGRTKTTGNFARIEKANGKGAAIAAYQNALQAHKGKKHMKKDKKHEKKAKHMKKKSAPMMCKMHKKMHCKKCA